MCTMLTLENQKDVINFREKTGDFAILVCFAAAN